MLLASTDKNSRFEKIIIFKMCIGEGAIITILVLTLLAGVIAFAITWVIFSLLLTGLKPELVRADGSVDWLWTLAIVALTLVIVRILFFLYLQILQLVGSSPRVC